jgi:hypothetical protein
VDVRAEVQEAIPTSGGIVAVVKEPDCLPSTPALPMVSCVSLGRYLSHSVITYLFAECDATDNNVPTSYSSNEDEIRKYLQDSASVCFEMVRRRKERRKREREGAGKKPPTRDLEIVLASHQSVLGVRVIFSTSPLKNANSPKRPGPAFRFKVHLLNVYSMNTRP